MNPIDSKLFTDPTHLAQLKSRVKAEGEGDGVSNDNLREVARQFESLFTHMLMKNMRAASLGDGAFDSDQSRFYQDMFDQQMSTELAAGGGLGIAQLLVQQLGGESASVTKPMSLPEYFPRDVVAKISGQAPTSNSLAKSIQPDPRVAVQSTEYERVNGPIDFVQKALPHARRVGKVLGVAPQLILAQAALESGWGQKTIRNEDGSNSNNLFGIKAGNGWSGAKAMTNTLEFASGVAHRITAPFRSYASMVESFNDYAQLLLKNDRYSEVVGSGDDSIAFAEALQRSGYATDPDYAKKIINIVNSETLKNAMHVTRQSQQR